MELADVGRFYDYVRYGVVAIVALLAVVSAVRRSKKRSVRADLVRGALGLVAIVIMGVVASATSWVLVAITLIVGVAVGFMLSGSRPLLAWLAMPTTILAAILLLWDRGGAFAAGLAILAFGVAIPLGQGVRGMRAESVPVSAEPETA